MNLPSVLHIDIDAFFAAVEVKLNPTLAGKPVIVGGMPHERGVVCTASYEARKYGVHSGMALRTAFQKCPGGVFLRGRYHVYSDISRRFFACLEKFSPRVDHSSIDESYIDLRGFSYRYSSTYRMAEEIKTAVEKEIGLSVSAGLGFTRLGAKLATAVAKPGNLFFVTHEKEFISSISLEKIPGIGPHTLLILNGLGVKRVNQLEQAYPSLWRKTIGQYLLPRCSNPIHREARSKSFSRETTFPGDITNRETILAHLAYLVDRLALHMIKESYFAGRVEVKLRFSDFSNFTRRCSLDFPTFSYSELWKKVLFLFDFLKEKKKLPLRLVGVKVDDLCQRRDLLPFVSLKGEKLSAGIGAIKEKYGFSAIFTARELLLEDLYPVESEGVVLKTASLTK